MRFIKAFLFGVTGLFIIITLVSLLIPSTVKVSRATVISSGATDKIHRQLSDLKNWSNWQPMFRSDSAIIKWGPVTEGKNAACDVVYNNKTTHIIITNVDARSVNFKLQSNGENDIDNTIMLTTLPASQGTQVEWMAFNKLHWYPWDKFYAIFLDKLSGPGYEAALQGLKDFIEKR